MIRSFRCWHTFLLSKATYWLQHVVSNIISILKARSGHRSIHISGLTPSQNIVIIDFAIEGGTSELPS